MKVDNQQWDKSAVKVALERVEISMADLARENDIAPATLRNVWRIPYVKGEQIIADAVGVSPELIWPDRYPRNRKVRK